MGTRLQRFHSNRNETITLLPSSSTKKIMLMISALALSPIVSAEKDFESYTVSGAKSSCDGTYVIDRRDRDDGDDDTVRTKDAGTIHERRLRFRWKSGRNHDAWIIEGYNKSATCRGPDEDDFCPRVLGNLGLCRVCSNTGEARAYIFYEFTLGYCCELKRRCSMYKFPPLTIDDMKKPGTRSWWEYQSSQNSLQDQELVLTQGPQCPERRRLADSKLIKRFIRESERCINS